MKPSRFAYWDPATLDEAVGFLAEHGDESKLLAGGQSLMPLINLRLARPDYLIDLNRVPGLDGVQASGDGLRIGTLARQEDVLQSEQAQEACPLLAHALRHVGHTPIRYRGTVGGSIAHADPAAEMPALAVGLDAELTLRGSHGSRTVAASEFFVTFLTTTLEADELLTEIRLPPGSQVGRSAVLELSRRHGDFALAGVLGVVEADDGRIDSARIAAFGVDEVPRRLTDVEELLAGAPPSAELAGEAAELAMRSVEPQSDMHASASYRRRMIGVLMRRFLDDTTGEPSERVG